MDLHTGPPFWLVRDGLPATYPALRQNASADVVVLGAGITGALVAYELVNAGADVIVIDRADVASGSSAATSGLLLYDTDASLEELIPSVGAAGAARVYQLGLQAIDKIERLTQSLDNPCGFARRQSLYLASRRRHVSALKRECEHRQKLGLDVAFLAPADLESRYSFSAPGAIYSGGTAEIDCYRFTHALLAAAARRGARIYDRTNVTAIGNDAHGIRLEIDDGHHLRSSRLVCATGYDVSLFLKRSPGKLASTWAFVSEPLDDFAGWRDRCLIWETARPYLYIRSTDDGRLLAGGEDEPYPYRHRRRTRLASKTERLLGRTRGMFPHMQLEPACSWSGTFATTRDGLPFIGELGEHPHIWFAFGYGGNGITFSVIAATLLGDWFVGRDNPDARLFSFNRSRR
jgi:glycine/D-amino acid oxidase-like deaminating enzyme